MKENIYKSMGHSGVMSIVLGICTIVGGIAIGVMLLVLGGRLLAKRSELTF